jgi:hypothetical protein
LTAFLLDTNVISAAAPTASALDTRLQDWLKANSQHLYLSVVSVAEIVSGIERSRRIGAADRAARLERWLEAVVSLYAERLLPIDLAASRTTGALLDHARARGLSPGFADLAIGGLAIARGLTVLTRNLRHFMPLGVPAFDPYGTLPT